MSDIPADLPAQHHAAFARGARCDLCPLRDCHQGPVPSLIRPGSKIVVLSEAPTTEDVETAVPLSGVAKDIVDTSLNAAGVPAEAISYTTAIACRPPGGHMLDYMASLKKEHTKQVKAIKKKGKKSGIALPELITPQQCCYARVERDIRESQAEVVLSLGTEALKVAAHHMGLPYAGQRAEPGKPRVAVLKKQHGSPVVALDGRILLASLHPGYIAFGGQSTLLPIAKADIMRAGVMALRPGRGMERIYWREPDFILSPSFDTCIRVIDMMREARTLVTVDIETDGIIPTTTNVRCVGLGAVLDGREVIIVVPLRHMNGAPWWTPGQEQQLGRAILRLMDDAPLNGFNLLFDTAVMLARGLMSDREKPFMDCMVTHHNTDQSELPHDLGFVAARAFEVPRWKDDADHKSVNNVDDHTLHLYNAKDVLGTMRLPDPLLALVQANDTMASLRTDLTLAPTARNMGDLGLNLNEKTRYQNFHLLEAAVNQRAAEVRAMTGNPDFNPNAFKQVANFLFVQKKLTPPFATDGSEWEEYLQEARDEGIEIDENDPEAVVDFASTNEMSLIKLLDLGVDNQTKQFIEALLWYRGLSKCNSTVIGLKRDKDTNEIIDTHRKKGYLITETHGVPGSSDYHEKLSILHPSWKIHIVPTGRWATSPNAQNWSERIVYDVESYKKDDKTGIINTRSMVEAPNGYVLVGADYAAIELRLYAIQANDTALIQAIWPPNPKDALDPHTLNFASMMASRQSDVMMWYERMKALPPKVLKYKRLIAKRFCIAEGELVLTRRGCIPIEQVLGSDEVWDGVEWVTHDGVICQGVKEVIHHDGLWATADHEVWTSDGQKLQLGVAQTQGLTLACTEVEGSPIQFVAHHSRSMAEREVSVRDGALREVRTAQEIAAGQHPQREVEGLPEVLSSAWSAAEVADGAHVTSEAALHQSDASMLPALRSARDSVSLRVSTHRNTVGVDEPESIEGVDTGPNQQRRTLCTGEPSLRVSPNEQLQSTQHEAERVMALPAEGLAVRRETGAQTPVRRADTCTDSCACSSVDEGEAKDVATHRRVVRVYDILNAGPRHRFTVSGKLVSNCFLVIYGGQRDKLYRTMAADRNPDGSRTFPDLRPSDIDMWWANWHTLHPQTKLWQAATVRGWQEYGYVASILDYRKRFFIGGMDQTAIPNHGIQGSAAAIMNKAMIRIAKECGYRKWGVMAGPILQVHDFVGLQVPLARQKDAERLLLDAMPYIHNGKLIDIEQKSGKSWDKI